MAVSSCYGIVLAWALGGLRGQHDSKEKKYKTTSLTWTPSDIFAAGTETVSLVGKSTSTWRLCLQASDGREISSKTVLVSRI